MFSEYLWNREPISDPPLNLGRIFASHVVLKLVSNDLINTWLKRHQSGDWGVVSANDWEANNYDLKRGGQILSAYLTPNNVKIWIITEASRSSTIIITPDEY